MLVVPRDAMLGDPPVADGAEVGALPVLTSREGATDQRHNNDRTDDGYREHHGPKDTHIGTGLKSAKH